MSGKKDLRKASKHVDEILMSDSDASLPDMDCDVCGLSFSNAKSYESHLQGKKHQKNVSEAKFMAKTLAAQKDEVDGSDDDDDEDDESSKLHCEVCDKYVSGYKSYAAHMKGSTHIKNVKKLKLKQKLGDMPEVLEKESKENVSDDDDDVLGKPYARCSTCQKEFSGPECFNLHLKSAVHKKKLKQAKVVQDLKSELDDGTKKSDDEEFFSKCEVCQKSFSGPTPYQIHMKSGAHAKNMEKQKVAEEMKEHFVSDDANSGYVCKECKKTFTDPLAFKLHLANNSHEKLKAKNALVEFLTSHPEIVFVTPLDKGDSGGSDGEDDQSDYYLICKLCHLSFSGPESAKDHVKSKKHLSAKKEKKLLKLLKEQNKSPGDKRGDDKDTKSSTNGVSVNGKEEKNVKEENIDGFEVI